ncbi:SDR family oxidoreductase [Fulvivirgaceae bacterium BMA10]|uniref:SDR family oxidoreductase n=1 Tax=Splendidivirga corallicola TaxID=3051826 RepID=A0ABT8KXG3_9BACT|nr:SDR family oxidoreductase [Fulvivirgaceae bacterium BMA10]
MNEAKLRDQFNLKDKVAVITGGTGVLGGVMARSLAQLGVTVNILGRNAERARTIVEEIRGQEGEAFDYVVDVLDQSALEKVREEIIGNCGKIDILINAAGGNMPGATIMPDKTFLDLSMDALKGVVDLNYHGSVLPTLVLMDTFVKQKRGIVINISSMAAQRPLSRVMGYASSKAAIDNFTKWLAVEMAKKVGEGIRVNAIAPGFFVTEQNRTLLFDEEGVLSRRGRQIIDHTPFKRFGDPEELIGAVVWLCSDASKFVTGTVIPVDGGFSADCGV